MKKIQANWDGNMKFTAENTLRKKVRMDAHEDVGGEDTAQTPMELLLSSLAGCMGINIAKILRHHDMEKLEFDMEGKQEETWPRAYAGIHMKITIEGDIPKKQVKKAVQLSHEKYCSVSNSLKTESTYSIEFNGEELGEEKTF